MLEPTEYVAIKRRLAAIIAAAGRDDPEHLADVIRLLDLARSELIPSAVDALRHQDGPAGGFSWADIARPLGITKQTAHERFRMRVDAPHSYMSCGVTDPADCGRCYATLAATRKATA